LRRSSPTCTSEEAATAVKAGRRCEAYSPTQFPEVVQVRRGRGAKSELICTGTVIAADWVITAAHCVLGDRATAAAASASNTSRYSVLAPFAYVLSNEYSHSKTDQERDVSRQYAMPSYSGAPRYEDDVALFKLSRPFPARALQPATLVEPTQISSKITLSGYGISNAEGGSVGYLNVSWPEEAAADDGRRVTFIPSSGTAFCTGDSGGPVFSGRYRGCRAIGPGGEPRPRWLEAVISSFSYRGIITPALSMFQQAKVCMDADLMIAQSLANAKVKHWICTVTENQAQGC
jgi:secreted trypsin-like serine protease